MNPIKTLLVVSLATLALNASAQERTDSFKVYGNCGMCKKRIEKAAKTNDVSTAVWNVETKIMTVTFDATKTNKEEIQKGIAAVGHDTERFKSEDATYAKLPGCCQYDRRPSTGKSNDPHKH